MRVSEIHLRAITREVLLKMLKEGIIPTSEQLSRMITARIGDLNLNDSEFAQSNTKVEYNEAASASKFNEISRRIVGDLQVLYSSYLQAERSIISGTKNSLLELRRLSRKAKSLSSRVNRLLLTTEKTGGLLNVFGDDFADISLTDATRSTVFIDQEAQAIHGQFFRDDDARYEPSVDLDLVREADIKISLLDPIARRYPGTFGSVPLDILTSDESPWMYRAATTSPDPLTLEIRIDFTRAILPPAIQAFSQKIVLNPFITNNSLQVLIQYSDDGIVWNDIPTTNPIRRIAGPTAFMMEGILFRHLRIIMTRDIHDNLSDTGQRFHEFGIEQLKIESVANVYKPSSEFYSAQHIVLDENGNRKKFSKASLSIACEHVDPDTDIDYFISFLDENLAEGPFQRVVPLSREDVGGPQIAEVGEVNFTNTTQLIDTAANDFEGADDASNLLLAGQLSTTTVDVWRNVGSNSRLYSTRQHNGELVEGGWVHDGSVYSTFIWIEQNGGQEFDFGPKPIEIDGLEVSGLIQLSEGAHFVRVKEENWYSLRGLGGVIGFDAITGRFRGTQTSYGEDGFTIALTGEPDVDDSFGVIDRLYPYNHKLIIEGLEYAGVFGQDIVSHKYKGVARYAAHFMQKVSGVDLENNVEDSDYSKFSIVEADDGLGDVVSRIMVKWNELEGEAPREQFIVSEKAYNTFAEGVVLKAVFTTTNPRRSASLDGYEIKVAD